MKFPLPVYSLPFIIPALVFANDWSFNYRPAAVRYATYGNSLGDTMPPTSSDRKIAFEVSGRAAREIFDAIGPDRKDQCTSEPGVRFRARDEEKISCTRSREGDYTCHFGFDLNSGKSIGGSIC